MKNLYRKMGIRPIMGVELLCALMILSLVPTLRAAKEVVNGIEWTYTIVNGEATVGCMDGEYEKENAIPITTSGSIEIPSVLGGFPVTQIGHRAFLGCANITSLVIPSCVTNIGVYTFKACHNLFSVSLPSTITRISFGSFEECRNLSSISIPDNVLNIEDWAFAGCVSLRNATIPNSVTNIGYAAFSGCSGLKSVTIHDSLVSISASAFSDSLTETQVLISDLSRWTTNTINSRLKGNRRLFVEDGEMTNLIIPDTITSIASYAFYCCSSLKSVTIPNSVTNIGAAAFSGCANLKTVTLPEGEVIVGSNAFAGTAAEADWYKTLIAATAQMQEGSGVKYTGLSYSLTNAPADRAIASITVTADMAVDNFVLKDGKVYDSVLHVTNPTDSAVRLTLPSGNTYQTLKGAKPLSIPANSANIVTITRVGENVFLVTREELETLQ